MASTHPPWLCQCHASVPLTRELSSQQFRSVLRHAVTLSFFLFDRGFNAAGVVPSNVSRARQHTANTSNSNNNIWWYGKCRKRHEGRRRESFFSFFRPCCARRCRATMTSRCLRRSTDARNHAPLPLATKQQHTHTQHSQQNQRRLLLPSEALFHLCFPLAATYPSNQLHHNSLFESERDKSRTGLSIPGKAVHAVILGSPIQKQYQSLDR